MVMLVILDDLLVEDSEFFNVTLTTTDSRVSLEPDAATVTIEDVDGKLLHMHTRCDVVKQNNIFLPVFRDYNWILLSSNLSCK